MKKRIFILFLMLLFAISNFVGFPSSNFHFDNSQQVPVLLDDEERAVNIAERTKDSVVMVIARKPTADGKYSYGQGTGFFITEDGKILTAKHVTVGSDAFMIITHNGTKLPAKLIKESQKADLALLQVDNPFKIKFKPLHFESPSKVKVGRTVYLIGSPRGVFPVFTKGYVSKLPISQDTKLVLNIQANPGNSGGPVIDSDGRVVGVLVSIFKAYKDDWSNDGISFAVGLSQIQEFLLSE